MARKRRLSDDSPPVTMNRRLWKELGFVRRDMRFQGGSDHWVHKKLNLCFHLPNKHYLTDVAHKMVEVSAEQKLIELLRPLREILGRLGPIR